MKRILAVLAMAGLWTGAAFAQAPNTLSPQEIKEGWKLLFNGKNLDGWTFQPGSSEWKVQEGVIFPESDKNGNLFTTEHYDNFVLRVEYRTTPDVNSGIYLRYTVRAPGEAPPPPPKDQPKAKGKKGPGAPGYEINIRDSAARPLNDSPAGFDTGSLMGGQKADKTEILSGQWNRFEITVQGDHFIVVHNGKQILDAHDSKFANGSVGLQWAPHTLGGKNIQFRNIKLRRL
jgi:hypothetical protein